MKIGLIGLGKMGYPLALNFRDNNIELAVYSKNSEKLRKLKEQDVNGFSEIDKFVLELSEPKVIWLMVPSGQAVDDIISELIPYLSNGDIIIDGGNSNYKDSVKRYEDLKKLGISFMDVGTSGGIEGARNGACLMIGGDKETYIYLENIFNRISGKSGFGFMGYSGAGHYVKMIHNAIEYGMMQAIGEGFQLLYESQYDMNLYEISKVWQKGSIISGLLMDTAAEALKKDGELSDIEGEISFSGEADWALEEAINLKVSIPVITSALFARYKSKDKERFSEKILSAMRNEFGGHEILYKDKVEK